MNILYMVVWGGFEPSCLRFIRTGPIPYWRPYHIFPRLIFLESNQIVCIFQILTLPLFYLLCEPNGVVLLIIFVNMCPFILYELSNGLLNFLHPYLVKLNGDLLVPIRWYNLHFSANVFRVVPKMRKVTVPWWTRCDSNARPMTLERKMRFELILFLLE